MPSKRNYFIICLCAVVIHGATFRLSAVAQDPASASAASSASAGIELGLQLGFEGNWKLGHLCPVRVDIVGLAAQGNSTVELQTLDGDGVTVTYRRTVSPTELVDLPSGTQCAKGTQAVWVPIRVGRQQAAITVRIRDADDQLVIEKQFEVDEFPAPLTSTQPLIVALGSTQGVETASSSNLAGGATTFATAKIQTAESLPDAASGYALCDLVILPTNDIALLRDSTCAVASS